MRTRDRLVEAMATSMRQRGFGSSAMKDVLDEAEATAGSMYHFFPGGKEQLATAAVRAVGLESTQMLVAVIENSASVADGAAAFFGALVDDMESEAFRFGCPIGVPATETAFTVDDLREASAEVFASWSEAIAAGLVREGWSPDEAARAAGFVVCAYEGSSTVARATRDASHIADTLSVVERVLRRSL